MDFRGAAARFLNLPSNQLTAEAISACTRVMGLWELLERSPAPPLDVRLEARLTLDREKARRVAAKTARIAASTGTSGGGAAGSGSGAGGGGVAPPQRSDPPPPDMYARLTPAARQILAGGPARVPREVVLAACGTFEVRRSLSDPQSVWMAETVGECERVGLSQPASFDATQHELTWTVLSSLEDTKPLQHRLAHGEGRGITLCPDGLRGRRGAEPAHGNRSRCKGSMGPAR